MLRQPRIIIPGVPMHLIQRSSAEIIGSPVFIPTRIKINVVTLLGRRVTPGKAGRPQKKIADKRGLSPILPNKSTRLKAGA